MGAGFIIPPFSFFFVLTAAAAAAASASQALTATLYGHIKEGVAFICMAFIFMALIWPFPDPPRPVLDRHFVFLLTT